MSSLRTGARGHSIPTSTDLVAVAKHFLAWRDSRRYSAALESDTRTYLDKLVWRGLSANADQRPLSIAGGDRFGVGQWITGDVGALGGQFPAELLDYLESRTRQESEIALDKLQDYMILHRSKIDGALEHRTDTLTELDELKPLSPELPEDPDSVTRRFEAQHELIGHRLRIAQQRQLATALSLLSLAIVLVEAILVYFTLSPVFGDTIPPSFVAIATISCSIGMVVLAHVGFFMRRKIARCIGVPALVIIASVLGAIRVGVISNNDRLLYLTSLALGVAFFITMIAISWLGARLAFGASARFQKATGDERRHSARIQTLRAMLDSMAERGGDVRSYRTAQATHIQTRSARLQRDVVDQEAEFHREGAAARRRLEAELAEGRRRLRPVIHNIAKQLARYRHGLANTAVTEGTNESSYFASDSQR